MFVTHIPDDDGEEESAQPTTPCLNNMIKKAPPS